MGGHWNIQVAKSRNINQFSKVRSYPSCHGRPCLLASLCVCGQIYLPIRLRSFLPVSSLFYPRSCFAFHRLHTATCFPLRCHTRSHFQKSHLNSCKILLSQWSPSRDMRFVRLALVTSVMCILPPVSFHISQESIVPNRASPLPPKSVGVVGSGRVKEGECKIYLCQYCGTTVPLAVTGDTCRDYGFAGESFPPQCGAAKGYCNRLVVAPPPLGHTRLVPCKPEISHLWPGRRNTDVLRPRFESMVVSMACRQRQACKNNTEYCPCPGLERHDVAIRLPLRRRQRSLSRQLAKAGHVV